MPPDEVLQPFALGMTAYVFVFLLGTLFGSFANVCIYRWPAGLSVVRPGSRCGQCETPVAWYDNIPIFSYLILRGRCRHCQTEFSARYMFVEAATGMLFLAAYHHSVAIGFPFEPLSQQLLRFFILAAFLFVLMVITFIDLDHFLILDLITFPAIPLFYGLGLLLPENEYWHGLLGAALGYGIPWLIGALYLLIRGRQGMGLGDAKFLAMVGALLGWQGVVAALFLGSLVGSIVSIPLVLFTSVGDRQPDFTDEEDAEEDAEEPREPEAETASEAAAHESTDDPDSGDEQHSDERADEPGDGDEDQPSLGQLVIPFGPFLAIGAAVYAFCEPWLEIRLLGM